MPTPEALEKNAFRESDFFDEQHDFSLVLGGPLFQLFRKAHLRGDHLELLYRRLLFVLMLSWVPLLLLSISSSSAEKLSFFRDVEVHVRFLVALPVLIAAELVVHSRIRPVVRRFVERRIVLPQDLPRFDRAIVSAVKLRNSFVLEVGLLLFVYTVGLWVWNNRIALDQSTWYALPGGRWHLTPAGYWYVFISIPILQFILLRWYVRLFIWFRFLWQVSRIDLNLIATHPDRCAGLAFLGKSAYAFGPILFAQGAMLAGLVASRVLYKGESLLGFKLQIGGFIAFFVVVILAPLLMFTPKMARAKRKGLADYGMVAQHYVESFEQKWVLGQRDTSEELLGTGDIQSLADLGNAYSVVREMRPVPFGLDDITRLAAATAAPLVPLLLTILSPEELIMRIIKVVF
ncbi:MAG TPA: hypothetical protein VMG82_03810 [Candidatus Sulfotelmatobacter sp.]|nr:hypothetical protein [Candidatus Sulfotelmatobacter sp.]